MSLSGDTSPGQSGPGSHGNEGVFCTIGASPAESYPLLTQYILQPQPTGLPVVGFQVFLILIIYTVILFQVFLILIIYTVILFQVFLILILYTVILFQVFLILIIYTVILFQVININNFQ